jgi:hypothetical protein
MYLAWHRVRGRIRFSIRESVPGTDGVFGRRELVDLGADPERFLVYPGGNAFYVHEEIRDALGRMGVDPDHEALDDMFWPFVDPSIRHALRGFQDRRRAKRRVPGMGDEERDFIRKRVHLVDKRRLNYLRLGSIDQTRLTRVPEKFYRPLAFKSRDELEQWFMRQEMELRPREYSTYVYSFLNLRRHFYEIFAGKMPQGLDQDSLDRAFLEDICKLNRDPLFWGDEERTAFLHPYLVRYAVMFFDYPFAPSTFLQDMLNDYISRRQHRASRKMKQKMAAGSDRAASRMFGVSEEELRSMSRAELISRYRKLAQKLHPDKGGSHEEFIRLTETYKVLLRRKRR